ncbi:phosphatidylinositol N-acetylglucosaminyltransferase subunit C [Obelidium mucronatum]|nr:phosphatidylinositol N-acetylglucosaminyltransferase subunit C [Obelidium mucronatum]
MQTAQTLFDPSNAGRPDNHVSPLFLRNLRRNANVKAHSYWPLVAQSCVVSQQISSISIFVSLFAALFQQCPPNSTCQSNALLSTSSAALAATTAVIGVAIVLSLSKAHVSLSTIWKILKGGLVLELILVGLTPILKTLTKDTSNDTIWALSFFLFCTNLVFCDYGVVNVDTVRYPDSFSINAAIFASVLLASRLSNNLKVFSLMSLSFEIFALFPILRRSLRAESRTNDIVMASLLAVISLWCISTVSWRAFVVHFCVLLFVTFICPVWFLGVQKYKDEIRGPWDEAKPVFRSP